jgi:hypothetical protein
MLNLVLNVGSVHCRYHYKAIGFCQQENAFTMKNIQEVSLSFPAFSRSSSCLPAGRV